MIRRYTGEGAGGIRPARRNQHRHVRVEQLALDVSEVEDETGRQVSSTRQRQNFLVILNFAQPLPKGKPARVVFYYDGRLTGKEDSPVFGIKFAALNSTTTGLTYSTRRAGFRWRATPPTASRRT